eukprot:TRINITY_DN30994_c0_g1_i1.p1 TRINITY_DN30994_c0_g1~~TRINITY_DN30994_c0_g1_i1.p1  ORF type:complete len:1070 (+),score=377.03 TRINITY_DN30994_c0_g1_i1:79-3288(+)
MPRRSLHEWIDEVAEGAPDRTAVIAGAEVLTYAGLIAAARGVMAELRKGGVRPGAVVGLLALRSAELIVGMLAALCCGASYMPLDPDLPDEKLRGLVRLGSAAGLLSHGGLQRRAAAMARAVKIPHVRVATTSRPRDPAARPDYGTPGRAAYLLFTSGSTGMPKCVAQTHRTVLHLFESDRNMYRYGPEDSWLLVHPFTFDVSVSDIFNALTCGGRLVVLTNDAAGQSAGAVLAGAGGSAALQLLEHCTVTSLTPSALRRLQPQLLSLPCGALRRLRLLVFSGEKVDVAALGPFAERFPGCVVVNKYGLSEVQDATYGRVDPGANGSMVGGALPGSEIHIVTRGGAQLVPPGEVGEIAVGGAQLAWGYVRQQRLTAERFVPDRFSGRPGARLFLTGDAGRLAADGSLLLLGRISEMVTIGGRVVDFDAAESLLREQAGVEVAAVARQGEEQLQVFFVARDEQAAGERLRQAAARLPHPVQLLPIDAFPLTQSGKINRGLLRSRPAPPAPDPRASESLLHDIDRSLRKEVGLRMKQEQETTAALRTDILREAQAGRIPSPEAATELFRARTPPARSCVTSPALSASSALVPPGSATLSTLECSSTPRMRAPALAPEAQERLGRSVQYAYLNGLLQQRIADQRPRHLPYCLDPAPFPRGLFAAAQGACRAALLLLDAASRDTDWMRRQVAGVAAAQPDFAGRLLSLYLDSGGGQPSQPLVAGIVRSDFMAHEGPERREPELRQVEINPISAAFLPCAQPVQRMQRLHGARAPEVCPDPADAAAAMLARASALARESLPPAARALPCCALFIVIPEEHLLAEQLIEQRLEEQHGVRCLQMPLAEAGRRLRADTGGPLLLDGDRVVTVVYYRAGFAPEHYQAAGSWEARALIERSLAAKCPSVGWHLAGTKAVQCALADPGQRLHAAVPEADAAAYAASATRMRPATDPAARAAALAAPHQWVLKWEREGGGNIAGGEEMVAALRGGSGVGDAFLMERIEPPVHHTVFVRDGAAQAARGIPELGVYGVFLGAGGGGPVLAEAAGYLVRTKPAEALDGGVCSGLASLDAAYLTD